MNLGHDVNGNMITFATCVEVINGIHAGKRLTVHGWDGGKLILRDNGETVNIAGTDVVVISRADFPQVLTQG